MSLPKNLENELIAEFKSKKLIEKIIYNKEVYKLKNYNIQTLKKIFQIEDLTLFKEINSKKHLNKILEMIKSNFILDITNNYLLFFNPINKIEEIEKRRKYLSRINFNFEKENLNKIKNILKELQEFNSKINLNYNIITIEKEIEDLLYNKYKLNSIYLSKLELEEYLSNEIDKNTIIISDEDLFIEIPVYSLKEFEKIIRGKILNSNKENIFLIFNFLKEIKSNLNELNDLFKNLFNIEFDFDFNFELFENKLNEDLTKNYKNLINKTLNLDEEIEKINKEIKEIISKKQLSLEGEELLNLLNTGDISSLRDKFKEDTKELILKKEKEILYEYNKEGVKINFIFENYEYPLKIDEELRTEIINKIEEKIIDNDLKKYIELGEFNLKQIKSYWNFVYFFDLIQGLKSFENKFNLNRINIGTSIELINGKNIYLKNPTPINYAIGSKQIGGIKLNNEKVGILTGANSGGKTTLLEMLLQFQILTSIGLGVPSNKNSRIKLFDEIIYLKKFSGTIGSGAFEQTIRNLVEILDSKSSKLILIDEFEAVTEPGAAARILIMFLKEIIKQDSLCVAASHLGQEIQKYIQSEKINLIRIDGISAQGLDEKGNLITNHQPEFYKLGKSTPELILKRILQDDKFWKNKSNNSKIILEEIIKKDNE